MKKEFSINLLILLALNLLIKPIYIFGIDLQIQNRLGPSEYGLFFSIFNYTLLFQVLLEFGITNLIKRDISDDNELAAGYFSGLLGVKILLSIVYIVFTFFSGWIIGYDSKHFVILAGMMGIQIGLTFISFSRATLAGIGAYKLDSLLSVFDKLVMILILGFLLYSQHNYTLDLHMFMIVYLSSVGLCACVGMIICIKRIKGITVSLSLPQFKIFLKKALPYALITFLMGIYGRIDAVFLERLLPDGEYQAGIYAAGYRLLDVYMMFALLFGNLLLPMLTKNLNDHDKMRQLLYFVSGLLMTLTIVAASAGFIYVEQITTILYPAHNESWINTIRLLIICIIPVGMSLTYGAAILSLGKLRKQNILFIIGVIVSILLNMLIIPSLLSEGAAIAALVVNSLMAVGQVIIFYKISGIKPHLTFYFKMVLFFPLCLSIFYACNLLDMAWMLSATIGVVITGIISILLKIFPREIVMAGDFFIRKK